MVKMFGGRDERCMGERFCWEQTEDICRGIGLGCLAAAFKLPARVAASWRCPRLQNRAARLSSCLLQCTGQRMDEYNNDNDDDGKLIGGGVQLMVVAAGESSSLFDMCL